MPIATTGLDPLDRALGGVFWGDNVVYQGGVPGATRPFVDAAWRARDAYRQSVRVLLDDGAPHATGGVTVDARRGEPLDEPLALAERLREICTAERRTLVVLDPLETLVPRWGVDAVARFFVHACPMMLGLGAVAIWQLTSGRPEATLRRRIAEVTQLVLAVGDGVLRVEKAEGRPVTVEGAVFRYALDDGIPRLTEAPAAALLGIGLRSLRRERRLSQADVARLAGVTPSAISQAERGERGLSLETLLTLTGRLGITIDELLRGGMPERGYRIARRDDPGLAALDAVRTLVDEPVLGVRVHVVRLSPGGVAATPPLRATGTEIVAVAQGLVQVVLEAGRPVLRAGETLTCSATTVRELRNLSDGSALAFLLVVDR